jgi:HEAT repeat protein
VQALHDRSSDVQARAEEALQELAAEAIPPLQQALNDKSPAVRNRAAQMLKRIEDTSPQRLLGLDDALTAAVQVFLKDLKSTQDEVRLQAADTLGYLGNAAGPAVEPLAALLKDKNETLRGKAAWALGHIGESAEDAVPALAEALRKDTSKLVRRNAAEALGSIRGDAEIAVPALAAALKDADEEVRGQAVDALGALGKPAVGALVEAVKLPEIRIRALQVLSEIGEDASEAVPAVREALKDADEKVRRTAGEVLKRIDPKAAKEAGVP